MARWLTAGDKRDPILFLSQHLSRTSRTSLDQTYHWGDFNWCGNDLGRLDAGRHMTWWWRTVCEKMLCVSDLL